MRNMRAFGFLTCLMLMGWFCAGEADGIINPSLQPSHLVERYSTAVGGKVESIDYDTGEIVVTITGRPIGEFEPKKLTLVVPETEAEEEMDPFAEAESLSLLDEVRKGDPVVAMLGGKLAGRGERGLLYAGRNWHEVQRPDKNKPAVWQWQKNLGDEMAGTFNGDPRRLMQILQDTPAGRAYFLSRPITRFGSEIELATLSGAIRGVGLIDINNDGRLDAMATGETGTVLLIQQEDGTYKNIASECGLGDIGAVSCSAADVDADGDMDLLLGTSLLVQADGSFARARTFETPEPATQTFFADINNDGRPDVIAVRPGTGLWAWTCPGDDPASTDWPAATAKAGLDAFAGAKAGLLTPGDFNGDGRLDFFVAAGRGTVLLQSKDGVFETAAADVVASFDVLNETAIPFTGGGTAGPIWSPAGRDLAFATDQQVNILANVEGQLRDVTGLGNEVRISGVDQRATLVEDLNMDGTMDILTLASSDKAEQTFHVNRNYGTFMKPDLYANYTIVPGKATRVGAGSAMAADVNGDGANDLLIGGVDGVLRLNLSNCLELREPEKHPKEQEKFLQKTGYVTVRLECGHGTVGAEVTVTSSDGRDLVRRPIGLAVLNGSTGPLQTTFAVRETGRHTVTVRLSDGQEIASPLIMRPRKHVTLVLEGKALRGESMTSIDKE